MIGHLEGRILKTLPIGVILSVGGVGYVVETPLSTLAGLSKHKELVSLWIHTHVREDSIRYFGFKEFSERHVFGLLLGLSGVGPKVALAILSTLGVKGIQQSAQMDSIDYLKSVPGIGQRLAEKILVELKSIVAKIDHAIIDGGSVAEFGLNGGKFDFDNKNQVPALQDVISALENLGFKNKHFMPILSKIVEDNPAAEFEVLLKAALGRLSPRTKTLEPTLVSNPLIPDELSI